MDKILIIFAHPAFERSRVHRKLIEEASGINGITIHDIYEVYPEFDIDIEREKELLVQHDVIIWQHPIFWYSGPALLKQWLDLVLEHGWAYGIEGHALDGKKLLSAITSGGEEEAYQAGGYQRSLIREFLLPFERTAQLCRMTYLPPFWVPGTHRLEVQGIKDYGIRYKQLLLALRDREISEEQLSSVSFLNDLAMAGKVN